MAPSSAVLLWNALRTAPEPARFLCAASASSARRRSRRILDPASAIDHEFRRTADGNRSAARRVLSRSRRRGRGGIPLATYVQVVCERAVVAGDRRRSHVIDVGTVIPVRRADDVRPKRLSNWQFNWRWPSNTPQCCVDTLVRGWPPPGLG
jgi:hypothetical protein